MGHIYHLNPARTRPILLTANTSNTVITPQQHMYSFPTDYRSMNTCSGLEKYIKQTEASYPRPRWFLTFP